MTDIHSAASNSGEHCFCMFRSVLIVHPEDREAVDRSKAECSSNDLQSVIMCSRGVAETGICIVSSPVADTNHAPVFSFLHQSI